MALGLTTGTRTGTSAYGPSGGFAVGMGAPGYGSPDETARTMAGYRVSPMGVVRAPVANNPAYVAPRPMVAAPPKPYAAPFKPAPLPVRMDPGILAQSGFYGALRGLNPPATRSLQQSPNYASQFPARPNMMPTQRNFDKYSGRHPGMFQKMADRHESYSSNGRNGPGGGSGGGWGGGGGGSW